MKTKTIEYFGHTLEVPKWARFVAMEEDGDVLAFGEQPHLADPWWFTTDGDEMSRVATISAENINYKNSVVELELEKMVISAKEAFKQTAPNCSTNLIKIRNVVETRITESIAAGKFFVSICLNRCDQNAIGLWKVVAKEVEAAGYKVKISRRSSYMYLDVDWSSSKLNGESK